MTARIAALSLSVLLPALFVAAPAIAQRDPAYAAARAAGQIGEQPDGYLGFATTPTPARLPASMS